MARSQYLHISLFEVTFAMIRPKLENPLNISIIDVAVYCPPNSKKKTKLLDYLAVSYHAIKLKHPTSYFILGGEVITVFLKIIYVHYITLLLSKVIF